MTSTTMMSYSSALLLVFEVLLVGAQPRVNGAFDVLDYVDPLIGTAHGGNLRT
jgi:hypothetical protein